MLKKLVGDRIFYKRIFLLMLPIMLQNGITNFVNMLDNIMIGSIGTAQMTGVAVTNQLLFVFNLCIFGVVSGAGIFGAQFFGSGDHDGVRYTVRFKLLISLLFTVAGMVLFTVCGKPLLMLYMQGDQGSAADAAETLQYASQYLNIMLIGLIPYAISQCYSSTLRESGHPTPPMVAGAIAVGVNLLLNYLLIFGKIGFPRLGVVGAAVATMISRFVELGIIVVWTHRHTTLLPFVDGLYRSLYVPRALVAQLLSKGLPLMLNETLWAAGVAAVNQCYSLRGLDAVAACNISQTFWNVFSIAYMAVGAAIAICIGQLLGANKLDEAKSSAYKLIAISFVLAVGIAVVYGFCAEFIPLVYNTTDEIRRLATRMMQFTALAMPFDAVAHSSYFTLRSGGKIFMTFVFDSGSMWCFNFLLAFLLSHYTTLPVLAIFAIVQSAAVFKSVFGAVMVRNGFWVRNIVVNKENAI